MSQGDYIPKLMLGGRPNLRPPNPDLNKDQCLNMITKLIKPLCRTTPASFEQSLRALNKCMNMCLYYLIYMPSRHVMLFFL